MRDFVSRRRHREKGVALQEGDGSEIVGVDCRAVSENSVSEVLARLVRGRTGSKPAARIDFVLGADVEFDPS